jgi:DNA-binding transcriptional LysR family regulator
VIAKSLAKTMPSLQYKTLKQYPQIVVSQSGDKTSLQKRETKGLVADSKKCFVTDHSLKHKMILNGFGWGRLPRNEIDKELKKDLLVEIHDDNVKPFVLDLHVMRLKNKPMGPVARAVWAQLIKNASTKKKKR